MSYEDLEGRTVLVTGGASGIGFAVVQAFAAARSHVVIVGRNQEKLQRARQQFESHVSTIEFDLNDIHRLPELVARVTDAGGDIDVLVHCAGIHLKKKALETSNQEYEAVVRTNQTAVFALTREVSKSMVARGDGNIVMISSMAAQYGIPEVAAYTASKSAIEGMTRALAVEWSSSGVRVNCVAPGFIVTPMSSRALDGDPERKARVLARTPMGMLGEPSDVANAVLFLASSQARYVTGVVLRVDGGNAIGF
jgi:NAD(P)-dependent dehydrogenase (short-subunit alcohol dehydrogenase family)